MTPYRIDALPHGLVRLRTAQPLPCPPKTMANTSSPKLCTYFLQGRCNKGDTCWYPHTAPTGNAPYPKQVAKSSFQLGSIQPCIFYESGKCNKGGDCPFFHTPEAKRMQDFMPQVTNQPQSNALIPCFFFFKQNWCKRGANCPFSHDMNDQTGPSSSDGGRSADILGGPLHSLDEARVIRRPGPLGSPVTIKTPDTLASPRSYGQLAPILSPNSALMEREFDGSKVTFGPGPTIHSVETVFESRTVILTNFPDASSLEDILQLFETPNGYKRVVFDPKVAPLTARIEFSSVKQAVEASEYLGRKELHGVKLNARMDNARITMDTGSLRSTKVKVSWFKPTRIAWCHYKLHLQARNAVDRLQGKTFDKHKLSIALQPINRNYRGSCYSIEIKGLPLEFNEDDLKRFCRAYSVTVGGDSFDGPSSYKQVERVLRTYGTIESIEAANDTGKSNKLVLFAHYREWSEAENSYKALHLQPQSFLRHSKLMVENVHSIRYDIQRPRYEVLKGEILKLQGRQPPGCKLRIYDGTDSNTICVRGYSSSAKALASLKISIEALIQGETLGLDDGSTPWEDQWTRVDVQNALLSLATENGCWIKFDTIHRRVVLFGSPASCKALRLTLLQAFETQRKRRHVIPLDVPMTRGLIKGGLFRIEQIVGEGKSSLDISHRTLTIEGLDKTVVEVKGFLHALQQPSQSQSGPTCPVCLGDPVNPTTLGCSHAYCTECITHYLKTQSTSRSPSCFCLFTEDNEPCGNPIATDVLRRLLTPEEEEGLFKAVYLDYIHSRPKEFLYCPTPDCPTIYRRTTDVLLCPKCMNKICSSCEVKYHDGITCAEYQEELKKELAVIESWKKDLDVRSCPSCKTNLQKEGGCNHSRCTCCSRHICWVCMETFEDSKSCYIHMGARHAGIGLSAREDGKFGNR